MFDVPHADIPNISQLNYGQIELLFDYLVDRYISLSYVVWVYEYSYTQGRCYL
jgi:hypothetical protein